MVTSNDTANETARLERKRRAKQVILEIVRQASEDHGLRGKLKLFKAFYLAHLLYAEDSPGYLTEWPIIRMPNGPGIDNADELFEELLAEGALEIESSRRPTDLQAPEVYHWTGKAAPEEPLPEAALQAIREAMTFVRDKSALQLSEWTHELSRSWNFAKDGEQLNIYIDLIPEGEYLTQKKRLDNIWMAIQWADRPPAHDEERSP